MYYPVKTIEITHSFNRSNNNNNNNNLDHELMTYSNLSKTLIVLFISLTMSACDESGINNNSSPNSNLNVTVQNSLPFQFSQQFGSNHVLETKITVNQVEIRSADSKKFTVLSDELQSFNLFELHNGNLEQLADANIAPDLYDQMRIKISKAVLTFDNEQSFDLTIPEDVKDGFTIDLASNYKLEEGNTGKLSVNFNVAESFKTDGETGTFVLNPTAGVIDKNNTGELTGQILNANVSDDQEQSVNGVRIWLSENGNVLTGTDTDDVHTFMLNGLQTGTYTLQATKPGFKTATIEDISIKSGDTVNRQITLSKSQNEDNNQLQNSDIRINEVGTTVEFQGASKWIEFKNTGNSTVDLSNMPVCIFGIYPDTGSLTVLAGNSDHTIDPGGFLVVAWDELGETEGEVGLYESDTGSFGNSDKILEYMQYGAAGSQARDGVADQAGIWTNDEFIPTVANDESYSYFEEPSASSAVEQWWPGIPTPGAENTEE